MAESADALDGLANAATRQSNPIPIHEVAPAPSPEREPEKIEPEKIKPGEFEEEHSFKPRIPELTLGAELTLGKGAGRSSAAEGGTMCNDRFMFRVVLVLDS